MRPVIPRPLYDDMKLYFLSSVTASVSWNLSDCSVSIASTSLNALACQFMEGGFDLATIWQFLLAMLTSFGLQK